LRWLEKEVKSMSEHEWRRPRSIITWGIIALVAIVGVSIALSAIFFFLRVPGVYYPFPFFPFRFGWIFGLFWIFIIFWAIRWLFWPWRWGYGRRYWRYGDESYYILRERYAKGEITKEQFDQMMRDLEQHS
jgi:putative membrane protein